MVALFSQRYPDASPSFDWRIFGTVGHYHSAVISELQQFQAQVGNTSRTRPEAVRGIPEATPRHNESAVAKTEPKTLLPRDIDGKPFDSRMIDFALILQPNERLQMEIRHVMKGIGEGHRSINQTKYAPVRYKPITVNLKVKPPGSGKNNATVQLTIWATAQFNKPKDLNKGGAALIMPLMSIRLQHQSDTIRISEIQTDHGKY